MRRSLKISLVSAIAVIVILISFENVILVSVAKNGIKHIMKVRTNMTKIAVRPLAASVAIKGFKIFNPEGYKEKILADISLVLLDFKFKTLFEPGAYFDKIEIHIDKMNVIRDKNGVINLSQMKAFISPQLKEKKPFWADKYIVEIEKVYFVDRTKPEENQIREINMNKKWEYNDVQDPDNLVNGIAYKVFVGGNMIGVGLELQKLQRELARVSEKNEKLKEATEKLKNERSGDQPPKMK